MAKSIAAGFALNNYSFFQACSVRVPTVSIPEINQDSPTNTSPSISNTSNVQFATNQF
jgi:hypothetical protein